MKTNFSIILLFSFNFIFSQTYWNTKTYNGIPSSDKKVIFFDDFSTVHSFWKKSDFERAKTIIKDGKCIFSAAREEQTIWQELVMDKDGYELEVKLSAVKGKAKEPLNILFASSKGEKLNFEIKLNGYYSASITRNGTVTKLIEERPFVHIRQDVNKIMIRVVDDLMYFFINEKFVTTQPLPSFKGYRYGIVATPHNPVIIDYFIISDLIKIEKSADFTERETVIREKEEKSRHKMN